MKPTVIGSLKFDDVLGLGDGVEPSDVGEQTPPSPHGLPPAP